MKPVTETFVCEVDGVSRQSRYLNGYGKPATEFVAVSLRAGNNGADGGPLRTCHISFPADLPIGTRFKVTVEQIDEVTTAVIHRGALPEIREYKQLDGEVQ